MINSKTGTSQHLQVLGRITAAAFLLIFLSACESPEEKAQSFLERGDALYGDGNYPKAELEYRNAIQINQQLESAWLGRAKIAEKQRNWQQALPLLNRVLDLNPNNVEANITLGKIYLAGQQTDKALEISDLTLELAPDDANVRTLKAAVLFSLGDAVGAVRESLLALKFDPDNVGALLVLATERMTKNDYTGAIGFVSRGLSIEKDNTSLLLLKIAALNGQGKMSEIIATYHKLIHIHPENKSYRLAIASIYISEERLDQAEQVFRAYEEENPGDLEAKFDVVRFLRQFKGPEQGLSQLHSYIKMSPELFDLQFGLADWYVGAEDLENASTVLRKVITDEANSPIGLRAKNRLAELASIQGDKDVQEKLILEILEIDPRNMDALVSRARIAIQHEEVESAINDLRSVLLNDPNSVPALTLLARTHLGLDRIEFAKDYYLKAVRVAPENTQIALEYSRLLLNLGEMDAAESTLTNIIARDSSNAQALAFLAQVKLSKKQWLEAQQLADRYRAVGGAEAVSKSLNGLAYQGQRDYDKSIAAFKEVHRISPREVRPLLALIQTYLKAGRRDKAVNFLESVLDADKNNVNAYLLLGRLFYAENNHAAAKDTFRSAIKANPNIVSSYTTLAAVLLGDDEFEAVESLLNDGLIANPNDLTLSMSLAELYEIKSDSTAAIGVYERILKDTPETEVAINNLAALLTKETDPVSWQRAMELASRFQDSDVPFFKDTLGWIHYKLEQYQDALKLLEPTAELLPTNPEIKYHLGMTYLALGDSNRAKEVLTDAIEISTDFAGYKDAAATLSRL